VQAEVLPYISSADRNLVGGKHLAPQKLAAELNLDLPEGEGRGEEGLMRVVRAVLRHSVNTWSPGFMDKLYASTDAVGVVSEVLLAVLNTNVCIHSFPLLEGGFSRKSEKKKNDE
jgi:hypothetical protein